MCQYVNVNMSIQPSCHPLLMLIFSSRSHNNWWRFSWYEGGSFQYEVQEKLSACWPPRPGKTKCQPLWSATVWWWSGLSNVENLFDVGSYHWSLHHYLSHTKRGEIWSLVLGCGGREWPHLINGRFELWNFHWIGQLWRFFFICQLYLEIRNRVKYCIIMTMGKSSDNLTPKYVWINP